MWRVEFAENARENFRSLGLAEQRRIANFITGRIEPAEAPEKLGKALAGPLKGFWRFRVGDYRIIAKIEKARLIVVVIEIAHRREVCR